MPLVLFYNITDTEKRAKLQFAFFKLGLRAREIHPEEYAHPIGYLAGREGFSAAEPYTGEGFSDEMLVLCDLSNSQLNRLLEQLRQSRATVALKAVLTEHNAQWSSEALHREISREHAAMQAMRSTAPKKGVHRKK